MLVDIVVDKCRRINLAQSTEKEKGPVNQNSSARIEAPTCMQIIANIVGASSYLRSMQWFNPPSLRIRCERPPIYSIS